ncbi:hypothetical protein C0Q70_18253 [Pomacea canaliculata]|uniref:Uncharacterized protein n=1 Tax=Pomacea canaliculata TaxID=400727 RepID=A0A2T7NMP0_POMCA|nr:hypothetical protein C0Q70_18253 [Pomacea canaliculata]
MSCCCTRGGINLILHPLKPEAGADNEINGEYSGVCVRGRGTSGLHFVIQVLTTVDTLALDEMSDYSDYTIDYISDYPSDYTSDYTMR